MISKILQKEKGKILLVAGILLMGSLLAVLFKEYGYYETWKLWKVPVEKPFFLDFRIIPGSAESFRNGFEPTLKNPYDPFKRLFNYPAFWRLFFYTDISAEDTLWIVIVMLVLYFAGVILFPQVLSFRDALLMLLIVFSPASMLLYERGNIDLFVFFICAMIVVASGYSASWAAVLIVFGAVVKLFPLFGVTVLLKEPKQRFWRLAGTCVVLVAVYGLLTFESQRAAWNITQRGGDVSYGAFVLVTRLGTYLQSLLPVLRSILRLKIFFEGLAAGLILLGFMGGVVQHHRLMADNERNLAAFRMGASIYLGTFLLGNNFDYRLAFLVFVVPQLSQWLRLRFNLQNLLLVSVMVAMYLSCWSFLLKINVPVSFMEDPQIGSFLADEFFNWMLLPGLAWLFGASSPDWFRHDLLKLLRRAGFKLADNINLA
jgi:hypothetical protein